MTKEKFIKMLAVYGRGVLTALYGEPRYNRIISQVEDDLYLFNQKPEDKPVVVQRVETREYNDYEKLLKRFKKFEGTWDKVASKLPKDIKGSLFPPLTNRVYDIKEDIRDFIIREESIRGQYMRQTETYEKPAYEVGIEEFYSLSNKQRRK